MGNVFGRKKKPQPAPAPVQAAPQREATAADKAKLELKVQRFKPYYTSNTNCSPPPPPPPLPFSFQVVRDQLKVSKAHAVQQERETSLLVKKCLADGNRDKARQLVVVVKNFRTKISACEGTLANVEKVLDGLADAQAMRYLSISMPIL